MLLSTIDIFLRLLVAGILGGVIGFEREFFRHEAGFRTNILVCIGSTLITLTSIHAFSGDLVDPSRVAAGIVTGIGFLGAGAIIHEREKVKGLTTAASLWVVAGVGMAVGSGFYSGAIITTLLAFLTLFFGRLVKHETKKFHPPGKGL